MSPLNPKPGLYYKIRTEGQMTQKEDPVDGFKKFEAQVVISRWGEDTTDFGMFQKEGL